MRRPVLFLSSRQRVPRQPQVREERLPELICLLTFIIPIGLLMDIKDTEIKSNKCSCIFCGKGVESIITGTRTEGIFGQGAEADEWKNLCMY